MSVDGGAPISTRAEPGLPYGFRAVLVEIDGDIFKAGPFLKRTTPLAANGRALPNPSPPSSPTPSGLRSLFWQRPAHEKHGACELRVSHLPGLSAQWGHVVPKIRSIKHAFERPLMSCVDTEYYLHEWPLDAGIDLDSARPGAPPPPLPNFRPVPGHPRVFQAPAWTKLVARRIHGGWLLVEGGSDPKQRLILLRHLRATIHLQL